MPMKNEKKEFNYVVTYLAQPIYYESVTYFDRDSEFEIIVNRKDDSESERIVIEKESKKILEYQKVQDRTQVISLKYMENDMYLCVKDSDTYMKSRSTFMLPIMFQCQDCFERSDDGMMVKNILIPDEKMSVLPYNYYCFSNKINIIKPGYVSLEYSDDGQLLSLRDFHTRCVKKRI